jgi:hypothetical protein
MVVEESGSDQSFIDEYCAVTGWAEQPGEAETRSDA